MSTVPSYWIGIELGDLDTIVKFHSRNNDLCWNVRVRELGAI